MSLDKVLDRIDTALPQALDRLCDFLTIPSVSTDPAYTQEVARAADWLVKDLATLGVEAKAHETPGHPIVVGTLKGPEGAPHLVFYGHYDVQPVDPLELWDTSPFEPQLQDTPNGRVIRARGASDDKGQLMTFVEACRAFIAEEGALPCTVTFFFEGEEESGGPSLVPFMEANKDLIRGDLALICDTGMVAPGVPSIASQLRGMLKDEFTITGPAQDLHSGHYGGPALNPLREIARLVSTFHDDQGRVAIEGFYEGVTPPSDELKRQWAGSGFDEAAYMEGAGLTTSAGEEGFTILEQQWARPTLEVNGLWGGYQGPGSKTVIPSEAHCKITCRLVGDMDPATVRDRVRAHVEARLSPDAKITWDSDLDGARASVMDTSRPEFEAARQALSDEWGREAVFAGMGGSIPVPGTFQQLLGMESLLIGFAADDDRIHSPNEKYDVEAFHKGTRSWARVIAALGA